MNAAQETQGRETASPRLDLTVRHGRASLFFFFLQKGVGIRGRVPGSVRTFLCEEVGFTGDYLDERVQTLFLDGKPLDDPDSATVQEGSILSLSAAMPGLLGATLRKGSYYAAMRSAISLKDSPMAAAAGRGLVVLRLFNLVIREMGPPLLSKGVWVEGGDLLGFFASRPEGFWGEIRGALLDGREMDPRGISETIRHEDQVFLRIREE
ncbi:MAG: hypothetical protein JW821_17735 [Deltaproteobacteria bacterium]|nr:hypothetical protein [Deltaproteobacteria bacterium]